MSYKIDKVLTMLDEVLMRMDRLERALIKHEPVTFNEPVTTKQKKKVDKPKLSVVKSESETNVVEFEPKGN